MLYWLACHFKVTITLYLLSSELGFPFPLREFRLKTNNFLDIWINFVGIPVYHLKIYCMLFPMGHFYSMVLA